MVASPPTPITIITGFVGSGKTTLITKLVPQLPPEYRVALIKNEIGDVAVDSELASTSAIAGVRELLNGCICCNLVGALGDALATLRRDHAPDRIIVETSGSAFPATLALEVNRLAAATGGAYVLDGVKCVIDVVNWRGYADVSKTAEIQARYTDLIVLSKWELVDERALETCEDRLGDINVETARVKSDRGFVDKDILLGLDEKLARTFDWHRIESDSHDSGHRQEVKALSVTLSASSRSNGVDLSKLHAFLSSAAVSRDEVYRIKAILYASSRPQPSSVDSNIVSKQDESLEGRLRYILNWAFGRWTFTPVPEPDPPKDASASTNNGDAERDAPSREPALRMTVMTAPYSSTRWKKLIESNDWIALENDHENGVLRINKSS